MDSDIANSLLMYALEHAFLEHKLVSISTKITKPGFPCYRITIVQLGVNEIKRQRTGPCPKAEAAMELPVWHQLWQRSRVSSRLLRRKLPSPHTPGQPSHSHTGWIPPCHRHLQGDEIKKKWHSWNQCLSNRYGWEGKCLTQHNRVSE